MVRLELSFKGSWFSAFRGADFTAIHDDSGPGAALLDNPTLNRFGARERQPSDSTALGILLRFLGEVRPVRMLTAPDFEHHFGSRSGWFAQVSKDDSKLEIVEETASVRRPDGGTDLEKIAAGLRMPESKPEFISERLNLVWWPLFATAEEVANFLLKNDIPGRIDLSAESGDFLFQRDQVHSRILVIEKFKQNYGPILFGGEENWNKLVGHAQERAKVELLGEVRADRMTEVKPSQIIIYACFKTLKLLNDLGVKRTDFGGNADHGLTGLNSPSLNGGDSLKALARSPATGGSAKFRSTPAKINKSSGSLVISFSSSPDAEKSVYEKLLNSTVTRLNVGKKGIAWRSDLYLEAQ